MKSLPIGLAKLMCSFFKRHAWELGTRNGANDPACTNASWDILAKELCSSLLSRRLIDMCKISTPPPGLLLVAPWQAPISWLLFTIVLIVLLRWLTKTYTADLRQPTSPSVRPAQRSLLIVTYTLLLACSFVVFLVATPSLLVLNQWFQSQLSLLSHTCDPYSDQYLSLNWITAQASHAETNVGLLSSAGLIVALICMGLYRLSRGSIRQGGGSRDRHMVWLRPGTLFSPCCSSSPQTGSSQGLQFLERRGAAVKIAAL